LTEVYADGLECLKTFAIVTYLTVIVEYITLFVLIAF